MHKFVLTALVALFLLVYGYTLAPSVASQGDSAELVSAAYLLAIPHPSGYPLFTIVGHLFTLLAWGSVAWRVNLFAAMAQIGTLVLIFRFLYVQTKQLTVAVVGTLALGFSYLFWLYGLIAEVFSLNDLIILAIVYVAWEISRGRKYWPMLFLLFGLGFSNHLTWVLVTPAIVYLLWPVFWKEVAKRRWRERVGFGLKLFGALALGLSPYLYIFWRAKTAISPVSWTYPTDLSSMWRLFTRADYGTFVALAGNDPALATLVQKWGQLSTYFRFALDDFLVWGLLLAVIGLVSGLFRYRKLTIFLLINFLSGLFFLAYANFPLTIYYGSPLAIVERFYLFPNLFMAMFIALGAGFAIQLAREIKIVRFLTVVGVVWYLVAQFLMNFPLVNQRDNYLADKFGQNLFRSVPPGAIVVPQGDIPSFLAYYARYVERVRPDTEVLVMIQAGQGNNYRYLRSMRKDLVFDFPKSMAIAQVISDNRSKPIYFFGPPNFVVPGLVASQSGFMYHFFPGAEVKSFSVWKQEHEKWMAGYDFPTPLEIARAQTLSDRVLLEIYADINNLAGDTCFSNADYQCARDYYQDALKYDAVKVVTIAQLGRSLGKLGDCALAEEKLLEVRRLDAVNDFVLSDLLTLAKECFHDNVRAKKYQDLWDASRKNLPNELKNL